MKILVIGGNRFTGEAFVKYAQSQSSSHEIIVVNRKGTCAHEGVTIIKSDRNDLDFNSDDRLKNIDICVDFCGYNPDDVAKTTGALNSDALYVYISSGAVYADGPRVNFCVGDNTGKNIAHEEYGAKKEGCENIVKLTRSSYVIIRPPYILGEIGRFTRLERWANMINMEMPIPIDGDGLACYSVIWFTDYVKILYNLMYMKRIRPLEIDNVFNVTSPDIYTTAGLIQEMAKISGKNASVLPHSNATDPLNNNYILTSNVPAIILPKYSDIPMEIKQRYYANS